MSRKFQVGDRVRHVDKPNGSVHTVVAVNSSFKELCGAVRHDGVTLDSRTRNINNIRRGLFTLAIYRPEKLKLVYDGNDPVSWSELADIWTPRETTQ